MNKRRLLIVVALGVLVTLSAAAEPSRKTPLAGTPVERLLEAIRKDGAVPVIVRVRLEEKFRPEPRLSPEKAKKQRDDMRRKKERVMARNPGIRGKADFASIAAFSAVLDEKALRELVRDDDVERIDEITVAELTLAQSIPLVGADDLWASPYNVKGANKVIVVVDTGVDKTHSFLKDAGNNTRVVEEACFSRNWISSEETCPNRGSADEDNEGYVSETGSGSAVPATFNGTAISGSDHGTRVAGIAAGSGSSFSGVAPEAKLIAINVASAFTCSTCPTGYKISSYDDSILHALDWIYTDVLARRSDVVSVNISMAMTAYGIRTSACDSSFPNWADAIDNLHAAGVAVVVASGNDSSSTGVTVPACIGNAITVGATTDSDTVPTYSNSAAIVDLLAPGGQMPSNGITSSVPGGTFDTNEGTSFAAPHVAGAYALLKQYAPNASVGYLLDLLIANGVPVTDSRNSVTKPRLDLTATIADVDNQAPTAPGSVIATATGTTDVQIDWNASTDNVAVSTYAVERKSLHSQANWDLVGNVAGNASLLRVTDSGRTAGSTYAYRVRAVDAAQNSTTSSTDYATTVIHENDPILEPGEPSGPTLLRGIHIGDLRKAADGWRNYAGLSDSFSSYAAETGAVDDAHFTAIVTALNDARTIIGLSSFTFTNGIGTPAVNVAIDDEHAQQLRDAMK